jgi:hypothetical protein
VAGDHDRQDLNSYERASTQLFTMYTPLAISEFWRSRIAVSGVDKLRRDTGVAAFMAA